MAATLADRLLPATWTDRARGLTGTLPCVGALGVTPALPLAPAALAPDLAVLGLGLGILTSADNATIMTAIPGRAAGTGGTWST